MAVGYENPALAIYRKPYEAANVGKGSLSQLVCERMQSMLAARGQ